MGCGGVGEESPRIAHYTLVSVGHNDRSRRARWCSQGGHYFIYVHLAGVHEWQNFVTRRENKTIARARVLIWLSRAAGKALRNDAQVLSYNGEVSIHIILILITVLAPRIIPDGGVMRTSLCQVTPFEGAGVWGWGKRR